MATAGCPQLKKFPDWIIFRMPLRDTKLTQKIKVKNNQRALDVLLFTLFILHSLHVYVLNKIKRKSILVPARVLLSLFLIAVL